MLQHFACAVIGGEVNTETRSMEDDGDVVMAEGTAGAIAAAAHALAPPNLLPTLLNGVSTESTALSYGILTNEDTFCNVLQRLELASDAQIAHLMREIRPVSKSAAGAVDDMLRRSDWLGPWTLQAQQFFDDMEDLLCNPAPVAVVGGVVSKSR